MTTDARPQRVLFLWAIVIALSFAALALSLAFTRAPSADEAWFASPALNLLQRGFMGTTILDPDGIPDRDPLRGIQEHTYWVLPLHILSQSVWYLVFGFSLVSMRAMSVAFGLVAVAALYRIVKELTGNGRIGLLAAFLLSVDHIFLYQAADGRMDMMSAALGLSGMAAYLSLRKRDLAAGLLLGHALAAASLFTHPNGLCHLLGLIVLTVYFDRSRLRWSHALLVALPYCAGAAAYGLYVLQNPSDWRAQFNSNAAGRFNGFRAPLHAVRTEIMDRYLPAYGFHPVDRGFSHLKVLILTCYVTGLAGVGFSRELRRRGGSPLILLWATFLVGMTFFHSKLQAYFVHILPWYTALVAVWLVSCWQRSTLSRVSLAVGVVAVFSLQVAITLHRVVRLDTYHRSFLPAVRFLEARSGSGKLVMGDPGFAFGVGFNRVLQDNTLGFHRAISPDFIALRSSYEEEAAAWYRVHQPAVYEHIRNRLDRQFRLVYDYGNFRVWQQRSPLPSRIGHYARPPSPRLPPCRACLSSGGGVDFHVLR